MVLDDDSSQDCCQLMVSPVLADVSFSSSAAEEKDTDSAPLHVSACPVKEIQSLTLKL